jgi:protein-S-isoprenylcysteine O-methyltransferase Ste14
MRLFVFCFLVLYAIERVLETFWRRHKSVGQIVARCSFPLILMAYISFYLLVFKEWYQLGDVAFQPTTVMVGTILVLTSIVGRNWSIRSLGIYHSIHVEIRDRHELIEGGPYRYVRNPYYLSNFIEALGLAMLVNLSPAVLIGLALYGALLIHRVLIEEKALEKKFGRRFMDYKYRVPRIIPRPISKN